MISIIIVQILVLINFLLKFFFWIKVIWNIFKFLFFTLVCKSWNIFFRSNIIFFIKVCYFFFSPWLFLILNFGILFNPNIFIFIIFFLLVGDLLVSVIIIERMRIDNFLIFFILRLVSIYITNRNLIWIILIFIFKCNRVVTWTVVVEFIFCRWYLIIITSFYISNSTYSIFYTLFVWIFILFSVRIFYLLFGLYLLFWS